MMLALLLLLSAAAADNCTHYFDGQAYSKEAVLTIKGLPTNLAYNPNTKELLFTLIDLESLHDEHIQTKMDQYILKEGNPIKVDDIQGQAATVDVKNNKVYIATDGGIAILDENHHANFFSLKDEDVVTIFKPAHKDQLYVSLFPENDVYVVDLVTKEKKKVDNIACAYFLAVDDKDNIYFECNSKYVKVLLKHFEEPIEFVGISKNSGRAVAVDAYNRVILAANDGLYHLRPDNVIPVKLMDLDTTPAGLAFDGNDVYISTSGVIYKYSMDECEVDGEKDEVDVKK